jgi:nitrile hydratase accessory protein
MTQGNPLLVPETFKEPWQARTFALVVALHERGVFTWPQWTEALASQIRSAQLEGDADLGDTYYSHCLSTLESMLSSHGVLPAFKASSRP